MSHFDGVVKAEVSWRWVWGEREEALTSMDNLLEEFGCKMMKKKNER